MSWSASSGSGLKWYVFVRTVSLKYSLGEKWKFSLKPELGASMYSSVMSVRCSNASSSCS